MVARTGRARHRGLEGSRDSLRGEPLLAQLGQCRVGLAELEVHATEDLRRLGELDLVVLNDLHTVAVGIEEVEPPARENLRSRRRQRLPHRLLVVDDEPKVAVRVRRSGAAAHERQELIAEVDEGGAGGAAAEAELEQAAVELEGAVEVLDLEGDVVDADRAWGHSCLLRAGSGGDRRTRATGSGARARPCRNVRGAPDRPSPRAGRDATTRVRASR